ncbi:MAG: DUF2723 domain-containing protein [Sphingobacteriales bacterium]|nr:DUF2723 domain-containing protein [Sphingobacteriales bacterium]
MNFRKVNNITGWAVFIIAFLTYFFTREARGSLWDCGEFVSSAYKVQLPHPPGAPLFVLLGRFFIILFGDNGNTAANAVNTMSALASGATILFLFWSITHFARKMFVTVGEQLTGQQTFTVMAAGVVGALAYTFSDSFWFSSGEGEVYALSSFFTALVFWMMLKWEHADEHAGVDPFARARSDRWIVGLFFMMGLSIGVHLLNLLTIPAIVMIYYYRRYKATTKGAILAFIVGALITGIVQLGVIQYSMKAAGYVDIYFVNNLKLPFFWGFAFYFIALAGLIFWALRFTEKNISKVKLIIWFVLFLFLSALPFVIIPGQGLKFLRLLLLLAIGGAAGYFLKAGALRVVKLSLWCYAFMMLGYFVYFTALIRSNANPSIDMNNVDNPINLVYYLSREQYGEAPLFYGPHFAATVPEDIDREDPYIYGEMRYVKGKDKYIPIGKKIDYKFNSDVQQYFPRIWDGTNDQGHADFYADWLNLGKYQDQQTGKIKYEAPTYADNFEWFFTYQSSFMYWRYFMWNFAGKQNDIQGYGNKRDGNWISGFSFMDNKRLGDQDQLPDSIKNNKAHNRLFMLPFVLGVLGCVYHFLKNRKDWIVNFLLFFMTGMAVVFYLNQPGNQPRERDYAYVSSFFAFAVWIGLAVVAIVKLAREKADKLSFQNTLIYGSALTFFITLMSCLPGNKGEIVLLTCIYATVLFAAVTTAITFLVRAVSSGGQNDRMLNITTTALCMIIPLLMAQQEWDDHNRSHKTIAPDIAKDYLESCAPNAVIFTFGDNDTYPLWYAQEVEGVRPDIRIINNSLLGIDWYINQLRYKVNGADSLDVLWTPEQIEGNNRARVYYQEDSRIDKNKFYPLRDFIDLLGEKSIDPKTGRDTGPDTYPVKRLMLSVDTAAVYKNGTISKGDTAVTEMYFEISKNYLDRSDLVIFNIISSNAKNGWTRPIYFTSPYGDLGIGQYLRKEGLAYRLVPAQPRNQADKWIVNIYQKDHDLDNEYNSMMNKFVFNSPKGVYFDEENRRHIISLRNAYGEAAGTLADEGRKEDALKIIQKCESMITPEQLPYAMVSRGNAHNINGLAYLEACYKAGNMQLAQTVKAALQKDFEQQKKYYDYIRTERPELSGGYEGRDGEALRNEYFLQLLGDLVKRYEPEKEKPAVEGPVNIINPPRPGDSVKPKDSNR